MGGDRVSSEYLKADLYHRAEALRDIPDAPLFFGRLDYAEGAMNPERIWRGPASRGEAGVATASRRSRPAGRALPHRPPARPRPATATRSSSTGARRCPGRSTGPAGRPDGPGAAAPVRVLRRRADRLRGRGVPGGAAPRAASPAGSCWRRSSGPVGPDARHRGDDPARPGRHRPRRRRRDRVRAGRAGHRQDRGRPAPGRLPALRVREPDEARRGAGDRAEPRVPLLHRQRAARPWARSA